MCSTDGKSASRNNVPYDTTSPPPSARSAKDLMDFVENPKNNLATEIISEDGVLLGKYFFENRSNVKHHELPENLINALIATEDIRYMGHSGIDVRSLVRSVVGLLFGSGNSGGASTITQQLAKVLFTEKPSSGIDRVMQKFKEWMGKNKKVLDLGCRDGTLTRHFIEQNEVTGMDIDKMALEDCKNNLNIETKLIRNILQVLNKL